MRSALGAERLAGRVQSGDRLDAAGRDVAVPQRPDRLEDRAPVVLPLVLPRRRVRPVGELDRRRLGREREPEVVEPVDRPRRLLDRP